MDAAGVPSKTNTAPARTTAPPPPAAVKGPNTFRASNSNHRMNSNNHHRQIQEHRHRGDSSGEHLRFVRRGGDYRVGRDGGGGHRRHGQGGFDMHRRNGGGGDHHGWHGPDHEIQPAYFYSPQIVFLPLPPPHHPLPEFQPLPPQSPFFAPQPPFFAPAYCGHMRGYECPGFALPLLQDIHYTPFLMPPKTEEPEVPLSQKILTQIEYYFSENNLCKDINLKWHMNEQGWVPLTLVAAFPKVQALTTNLEIVRNSLVSSSVVEIENGNIRRRTGWEKYILPRSLFHEG